MGTWSFRPVVETVTAHGMSVASSPGVKREAGASATNSHGTAKKPKLEYKLRFSLCMSMDRKTSS